MRYLTIILPILLVIGCSDDKKLLESSDGPGRAPGQADWLTELIASLESERVRNPPALIARYSYKDEIVYYVPSYCCDEMSTLYSSEGEILCSPDGGLSGDGDGICPDFFDLRTDEEIIWQDTRTR